MRCTVALAAIMTLLAAGPLPVSACALVANLLADCQPQPECHTVPTTVPTSTLDTPAGQDCCALRAAPQPLSKEPSTPLTSAVAPLALTTSENPSASRTQAPAAWAQVRVLPSDFQAHLCVFLI